MWPSYFRRSGYPPSPFSNPKPNECKSYLFKTIRVVDEVMECIINLSIETPGNKSHKKASNSSLFMHCFFFGGGGLSLKEIYDTDCLASTGI